MKCYAYPRFFSEWNEDHTNLTTRLDWWGGPKWALMLVSKELFDEGALNNIEFKLVRVGPWDAWTRSAPFVRLDGGFRAWAQIVWHWTGQAPYRWARSRFWRVAFRLNMVDCHPGSVPTWRNLRWPGKGRG